MLDLLTPEAQAGAYEWAAVLLAHAAIGLGLTALVAALIEVVAGEYLRRVGGLALGLVALTYGLAWEGLVQGYGAGLGDAAVDTAAVVLGGALGLAAWARSAAFLALSLLALAGIALAGIRRRR